MEKERDMISNGSYLFRLNEELSGQSELDPYFINSGIETEQETRTQTIDGEQVGLLQGNQDNPEQ